MKIINFILICSFSTTPVLAKSVLSTQSQDISNTEADTVCTTRTCFEHNTLIKTETEINDLSSQIAKIIPEKKMQAVVKNYSESSTVDQMVKWTTKNINKLRGGGKCYRLTKKILAAGGLIAAPFSDGYARNALNTLPKLGFINLLSPPYNYKLNPDNAPKGSVLVYESNHKCDEYSGKTFQTGCGHIEVKLGDGKKTGGFRFASDYKNDESILEGSSKYKYRLAGVMIKPLGNM
jgi:hypothetical protein